MQSTEWIMIIIRMAAAIAGLLIILATLVSAIKTFVMPRGVNVWLTRAVFGFVGFFFRLRIKKTSTYEERDRIMAFYAPLTLVLMPAVLLTLVLIGYACLYWAIDPRPIGEVLKLSGSSLLTLGYASVDSTASKILEFSEAMLGLILVALLIAYLPTIYGAFSKRETAVALLETRASSPPSAQELIWRSYRTGELAMLRDVWEVWQIWFAELEESHTSLAPLAFFRSPQPERSWITAAGTIMDTAALILAVVDIPFEPQAAFCIRSGFLSLRRIADFFSIPYDADPAPNDPISITRLEFDQVYEKLLVEGVPLKTDRELAWADFSGWRVNYDQVLLRLAALTMAPYAPWASDRSSVGQGEIALK